MPCAWCWWVGECFIRAQRRRCRRHTHSAATHLVAGTNVLRRAAHVHALRNVGRLLLNGHNDVARLVVKALGGVVVADVRHRVADHLLVVHRRLGGDLAKDHHHARLGGRLARHLAARRVGGGAGARADAGHGSRRCTATGIQTRTYPGHPPGRHPARRPTPGQPACPARMGVCVCVCVRRVCVACVRNQVVGRSVVTNTRARVRVARRETN